MLSADMLTGSQHRYLVKRTPKYQFFGGQRHDLLTTYVTSQHNTKVKRKRCGPQSLMNASLRFCQPQLWSGCFCHSRKHRSCIACYFHAHHPSQNVPVFVCNGHIWASGDIFMQLFPKRCLSEVVLSLPSSQHTVRRHHTPVYAPGSS